MKRELSRTPIEAIKALVIGTCKYPDQCKFVLDESRPFAGLTISPHMADIPIFIGKAGRQINALKFISAKGGVSVQLVDSFIGGKEPREDFIQKPEADTDAMVGLLLDFCAFCFDEMPVISPSLDVDVLTVTISPIDQKREDSDTIAGLGAIFYGYGVRQGCIMQIRAVKQVPV